MYLGDSCLNYYFRFEQKHFISNLHKDIHKGLGITLQIGGVKYYLGLVRNWPLTTNGNVKIWAVTPVKIRRWHARNTCDDGTAGSVSGVTIWYKSLVIKHGYSREMATYVRI